MYNCYTCKAKSECSAAAQPGSIMCMVNRMRFGGDPRRRGTDPTAWSILPILRASAAGDRNGAFL